MSRPRHAVISHDGMQLLADELMLRLQTSPPGQMQDHLGFEGLSLLPIFNAFAQFHLVVVASKVCLVNLTPNLNPPLQDVVVDVPGREG